MLRHTYRLQSMVLAALGCFILIPATLQAVPLVPREDLGTRVKMTILVDKVMQPEAGWITEEWMVKEAAEAGFNVFSPRVGGEDLDAVRQVTEWCAAYGMYHIPWMRGTLVVPPDADAAGKKLVWRDGAEQELWSPNSDELWEWKSALILEYARISVEQPELMGVFLDYENYSPLSRGNCYELSYDDTILALFAAAEGIEIPTLPPHARYTWLNENDLHEAFEEFQINHWRERCRALRQAVDALNPQFQFCIYPAPGTPFMLEACYPEWATEQAPLIAADPWTYGRPARYISHERALSTNRDIILRGQQEGRERNVPLVYLGGIDPVVLGADPEFSGKNALMLAAETDGYWIFYEGPTYKNDHPDYMHWFTWANTAIREGRFEDWKQPRETPDPSAFPALSLETGELPQVTGDLLEFPQVRMRGGNAVVVTAQGGRPVGITMQHQPIGQSETDLEWEVFDRNWQEIAAGTVAHGTSGDIAFTPPADDIYIIIMNAGGAAYAVENANVPVGLFTWAGLRLIYDMPKMYFHVPEGLEEFTFNLRGWGVETIRLTVFDPTGEEAGMVQTTPQRSIVSLTIKAGEHAGAVWSLKTGEADEGVLEDNTLTLDANLPPTLSFFPEQVFKINPAVQE